MKFLPLNKESKIEPDILFLNSSTIDLYSVPRKIQLAYDVIECDVIITYKYHNTGI